MARRQSLPQGCISHFQVLETTSNPEQRRKRAQPPSLDYKIGREDIRQRLNIGECLTNTTRRTSFWWTIAFHGRVST